VTETISYQEIGVLLGYAATRDQRTVGDTDIVAWHKDLNAAQVTFADAEAALDRYYAIEQPTLPREHRFRVVAADIIATARKVRAERLKNWIYEPPPTERDPKFIERYRSQLGAVASGMVPAPSAVPGVDSAPHLSITTGTQGIGRPIPAEDPIAVARRAGPLGVECPECHAVIGRRCRNGGLGKPRRMSHGLRLALAAGKPLPSTEDQQAAERELERRLAVSRAVTEREPSTFVPPTRDQAKKADAS
jgi:hypothetical protein